MDLSEQMPPEVGDWQVELGERGFRFTHPRGQFGGPSSGFAVPDEQVPEIAAMVSAVLRTEQCREAASQPHGPWLILRRPEWRRDWTVLFGPVIVLGTDGPGWGSAGWLELLYGDLPELDRRLTEWLTPGDSQRTKEG